MRLMCVRYSRAENASPPGNRSGTYPVDGRPDTRPAEGTVIPAMTRSSVDLPLPFLPSSRIS
jgi:hypothetical protein